MKMNGYSILVFEMSKQAKEGIAIEYCANKFNANDY